MMSPNAFAERYVALWNETDPQARRRKVDELYSPDAVYIFYRRDPFRGREAIAEQVTYTADLYHPMGYVFRPAYTAIGHHNLVRFNWAMVHRDTGDLQMAGQNVVALDENGLIVEDYQFHDRIPTAFRYNDGFDETGKVTRKASPIPVAAGQ
ncbi:nuclear transport factor 2 family protein [Allorhizocola rhizosphaerae]|uniref:nuclear transport factor 2 family protein n=1 Tax=Allorhizocola rhizosphaerae TaxID=1872709 RepID=UPI000E3C6BA2|nr:nuclear transport factor 2 family protein [Allorhizocola rhizosphaerae]